MASFEEIGKAFTAIEVAFPGVYQNMDLRKITAQMKLWNEMFSETPDNLLAYAVKLYIANDTTGFPPTVGRINEIIRESQEPATTEIEAWQMIKRAIRESYDYESAKREWEKLPEEVRAPVRPGDLREWGGMDSDMVNTTISAAYRRSFTAKQKRTAEQKALPESVRNLLPVKQIE